MNDEKKTGAPATVAAAPAEPMRGDTVHRAPGKETLNDPTRTLFAIVVACPFLARQFGVSVSDDSKRLIFADIDRPWLKPEHPSRPSVLKFDPDRYAERLGVLSHGEKVLSLFVLNLWNRHYAADKGWRFDLFEAAHCLDGENLAIIFSMIQSPVWP